MGFALVALLCVVLMALTVARGWDLDLVHAGKPLAGPARQAPVGPSAQGGSEPVVVGIPAELRAQPVGVGVTVTDRSGDPAVADVARGSDPGPRRVTYRSPEQPDRHTSRAGTVVSPPSEPAPR